MFKTPVMRKSFPPLTSEEGPPPPKRGRSSEDFLMFCKMILDYENYEEGESVSRYRHTSSPLGGSSGSLGSQGESSLSSFTSDTGDHDHHDHHTDQHSDTETDNAVTDDYDEEEEITCFCRKPYGGRPMIECSSCATWVHLTCAKVKRSAIPDTWHCSLCKPLQSTNRLASRARRMAAARERRRKSQESSSSLVRSNSKRKL